MKLIPLTNSSLSAIVDDDFDFFFKENWCELKGFAARSEYLGKINGKYKNSIIFMHRKIINAPKGLQVDHINHNKLDNRKSNLRLCSNQENSRNMRGKKKRSGQFKGVSWDSENSKWRARIRTADGNKNIGRYLCEIAAARAYDDAARLYFGEFAYLNYP